MNNDVSIKTEVSVAPHNMMHQYLRNPSTPEIHICVPNISINVLVAELKGTLERSEKRRKERMKRLRREITWVPEGATTTAMM